jgi:hypothetical protein
MGLKLTKYLEIYSRDFQLGLCCQRKSINKQGYPACEPIRNERRV